MAAARAGEHQHAAGGPGQHALERVARRPDQPLRPGTQVYLPQRAYRRPAQVTAGRHRQVDLVAVGLPGLRGRPGRPAPQHRAGPVAVAGHRRGPDDHGAGRVRADRAAELGRRVGPDQPAAGRGQHHLAAGAGRAGRPAGHGHPGRDHLRPAAHRHDLRARAEPGQRADPQRRAGTGPVGLHCAAQADDGQLPADGGVRLALGRRGAGQPRLGHPRAGQQLGPPGLPGGLAEPCVTRPGRGRRARGEARPRRIAAKQPRRSHVGEAGRTPVPPIQGTVKVF